MAIVAVFDLPGVTQTQYDLAAAKLTGGNRLRSHDDWPVPGPITHVAAPTPTGWLVVDTWESREAFEQFAARLMPVLDEVGIPVVAPEIHAVHTRDALTGDGAQLDDCRSVPRS